MLLRRFEDHTAEALSCSGQAVQKVRLDFGWEGALVGEGIEGVEMEWNALCYDITVSCKDATVFSFVTAAFLQYVNVITHTVGLLDQHTQCDAKLRILSLMGSSNPVADCLKIWYSTSEGLNIV